MIEKLHQISWYLGQQETAKNLFVFLGVYQWLLLVFYFQYLENLVHVCFYNILGY